MRPPPAFSRYIPLLLWLLPAVSAASGWDWLRPPIHGHDLHGMHFSVHSAGVLVGQDGAAVYTEDAGASWHRARLPANADLRDVFMIDDSSGWAVGGGGAVYATSDGAKTWKPRHSGVETDLYGVSFVNPRMGWAAGDAGTVLHTINGGDSWIGQTTGA